ncbi:Uncharacterised protein [Citrobacter koseri]|uniref:Uncharacterized protein n=1 Tax=Citrobacter koseri TaxID=545 RepID=A0A3S4IXK4_CITKO|nr:Uncharacterised protein [Citrobacter koseri]
MWALIPLTVSSSRDQAPGFCGWPGRVGESRIRVLFRKSIHYAPPIKKPDAALTPYPAYG